MIGYYKIDKSAIERLGIQCENIENNIYHLCCPLIVTNKKVLPKDLKYLYEILEIPIISLEQAAQFNYSEWNQKTAYLEEFSKYLELNVAIEIGEEQKIGHLLRVGRYAKELATSLSFTGQEVNNIYIAAIFHDIGKHLISKKIIGKNGKLTAKEFEVIKTHCTLARSILGTFLDEEILDMIESHHERLYGRGYPNGIEPSIGAQIIGIADSYDAMTSKRVYHDADSKKDAFQELRRCTQAKEEGGKGILYSAQLVEQFIKIQQQKREKKLFSIEIPKKSTENN